MITKNITKMVKLNKVHVLGGEKVRECVWNNYKNLTDTEKETVYDAVCNILVSMQFDQAKAYSENLKHRGIQSLFGYTLDKVLDKKTTVKDFHDKNRIIFTLP